MKTMFAIRSSFAIPMAALALATVVALPVQAQQQAAPTNTQSIQPPAREGFWGRVNPFARKKWVDARTAPINDHLKELDEVNAKNAADIKDVDGRAQAGIKNAQSTADAANQAAGAAGQQAQQAGNTAAGAAGRVGQLNAKIAGLDQYRATSEIDVAFRGGLPVLSAAARKQLDDLAATLGGRQGYLIEIEAHNPAAGAVGINNSDKLAEAVSRYLVSEHAVPVYRLHAVALGNATTGEKVRTSSVHLRLLENSLATGQAQ